MYNVLSQFCSWYFKAIDRKEAEKLLMDTTNANGAFLVRDSKSSPGSYSLSIRDAQKVTHHKIQKLNDGGYFVTPQFTFASIPELVAHYSKPSEGLLKSPCVIKKSEFSECETDRKSITLVKKIGAGRFGEVWQGIWDGIYGINDVAVKVLKPDTMRASEFLQEAALMKKLKHPNLIRLYAVCTMEEPVYIITELMKHGNLLEYFKEVGHSLTHLQLIDMGTQVAAGMAYLEENNYIHRDLAARNVLVGEPLICKVADFGLARVIDEGIYRARPGEKFPIKWTAPEGALNNHFTIKSDVWSFGILLCELITYGQPPYPGMSNAEVTEKVETGYRMPCPSGCPQQLYEIMLECWSDDAASRPTFATLQQQLKQIFFFQPGANYRGHSYRHLECNPDPDLTFDLM